MRKKMKEKNWKLIHNIQIKKKEWKKMIKREKKTSLNALCVNYYSEIKKIIIIFYIECHSETWIRRWKHNVF